MRAIDPRVTQTPRRHEYGSRRRRKIIGDMVTVADPRGPGILPSFERNFHIGSRDGIQIPSDDLDDLIRKWTRGLHDHHVKQLVRLDIPIDVLHVRDEVAAEAFGKIVSKGTLLQRGPGIDVICWIAQDSERTAASYAFNIWQAFRAYAYFEATVSA